MQITNFENLVDKDKNQVFVFYCPAYIPVNFAIHPWFLVNRKGVLSRYEIFNIKNFQADNEGFINIGYWYKNGLPTYSGIQVFPYSKKYHWNAKLLGVVDGDDTKVLEMIELIENSDKQYPHIQTYRLLGPNSNTYVNWILSKFPEFKIKLPLGAIGKNYK